MRTVEEGEGVEGGERGAYAVPYFIERASASQTKTQ